MKIQTRHLNFWALLSLCMLIIFSCKNSDSTVVEPPQINPEFEMKPPLATDIEVKLLQDNKRGNLLFVADMGQSLREKKQFSVQTSDGVLVLRDDGQMGDEEAGDGRFSIILKENLDSLNVTFRQLEENKERIIRAQPFEFKGRELVQKDHDRLKKFRFEEFQTGKKILFPKSSLCKFLLNVSREHSLFVTNLDVVEDPGRAMINNCDGTGTAGGAWSFQHLVTEMANTPVTGVSAEDFVKDWLETWLSDAVVNSENIPARTDLFGAVISPWLIQSGSPPGSFNISNWKSRTLDLSIAPFKLTAIVNRLDLRGNVGYGVSNAGEGRFIYEVLAPNSCTPFPGEFNVIFEYGIPIKSCANLKAYGQDWYDLKNLALGSPAYNAALQSLTDVFVSANASPTKPNGSAINQIRTNERTIGAPWELREFIVDDSTNRLVLTTVKQEPAVKYNENAGSSAGTAAEISLMVNWVNTNAADIMNDKHEVPLNLPTSEPFLGGKSHSEPGFWTGTGIIEPEARHHFSLNTCSGCHFGETGTPFVHLTTVPFGMESVLSDFLTGANMPKPDPAGGMDHSFNDLLDREDRLEELLCNSCSRKIKSLELASILRFDPKRMVH